MNQKGRVNAIDLLRAVCIIWIVLVWHGNDYLDVKYHLSGDVSQIGRVITFSVLACFCFISGLCLRKYSFDSKKEIVLFYYKRALRIFPLLVLSSVLLYFMNYFGKRDLLYTILGIGLLTPSYNALTVWFMAMMMFLYFLTPLIKFKYKSKIKNYLFAFLMVILFAFLYSKGVIDKRLLMYSPFYFVGLLIPFPIVDEKQRMTKSFYLFLAIVFILGIIPYLIFKNMNLLFPSICCFIIWLGIKINGERKNKLIMYVSFSSLCLYLFHRQLYFVGQKILYVITGTTVFPIWFLPLFLMVMIIVCFWIQTFYDRVVKDYSDKLDVRLLQKTENVGKHRSVFPH